MDKAAVSKAKERLRTAGSILDRIAVCRNYQEFTGEWYLFLVAAKNIYTALEQGSKMSPQSRQWYGAKKKFRKQDELLEYLFIARDDAEHGIAPVTARVPGSIEIGNKRIEGTSTSFYIERYTKNKEQLEVSGIQSLDGLPVNVRIISEHAKLITVTGRSNDKFDPPRTHMGSHIFDDSPLGIGRLALTYFESLVSEAASLS